MPSKNDSDEKLDGTINGLRQGRQRIRIWGYQRRRPISGRHELGTGLILSLYFALDGVTCYQSSLQDCLGAWLFDIEDSPPAKFVQTHQRQNSCTSPATRSCVSESMVSSSDVMMRRTSSSSRVVVSTSTARGSVTGVPICERSLTSVWAAPSV